MAQVLIEGGSIENTFHTQFRFQHETETLAAGKTLTKDSPSLQFLDPGGAGRTIVLPAEADSKGLVFFISNEADAAEILTINDDAAATIVTPTQNEAAILFCDGTTWSGLVGATS